LAFWLLGRGKELKTEGIDKLIKSTITIIIVTSNFGFNKLANKKKKSEISTYLISSFLKWMSIAKKARKQKYVTT